MRILPSLLLSTAFLSTTFQGASAETLTVAAGGGYHKPVSEAVAAFEKQSGEEIDEVYGNLGQITAQARESGVIGMLCGDRKVLDTAKDLNFSRFVPLGKGALVVGYRKGMDLATPADIAGPDVKRIAMPDEKAAIYGMAGREYLVHAGLDASVDPKLMVVASVPQVTAYLVRGEVDAGLMNATDALGAGDRIGGFIPVDPELYDPIRIDCGILDEATAKDFAAFLGTDTARAIMTKYGM